MADRQTSDPRRDGERRQPSREVGERRQIPREDGERRQMPRESGERRQMPRESGERRQMSREGGERRQIPRESGERRQMPREGGERRQMPREGGERRQMPREGGERRQIPRESSERRQAPSRRNDVIRCENCGEDYSITYRRCPFCDERPGRGGGAGKRVANTRGGGYGRPVNPIQVVWLVISLVLIISALFIVFRFIGSPLFGGGTKPGGTSSDSSQGNVSSSQNSGSQSEPGGADVSTPEPDPGPDVSTPEPDPPPTQGTINANGGLNVRSGPGREHSVQATVPNGSTVSILGEENGWYQIQYNGNSTGYVSKDYVSTGGTSTPVSPPSITTTPTTPSTPNTTPPSSSVTAGTKGTITGADTGLNIRSGPGREYDVVASAQNGAEVTIQGEENGWYKVTYNGSKTGYVSKDFVSVR